MAWSTVEVTSDKTCPACGSGLWLVTVRKSACPRLIVGKKRNGDPRFGTANISGPSKVVINAGVTGRDSIIISCNDSSNVFAFFCPNSECPRALIDEHDVSSSADINVGGIRDIGKPSRGRNDPRLYHGN
jgi:hypothetical protein